MTTTKLKRGLALVLFNVCAEAGKHFGDRDGKMDRKLAYASLKNVDLLRPEMKIRQELLEPYEKAKIELLKSYAKKDEAGEPIVARERDNEGRETGRETVELPPEAVAEYNAKLADLQKEHDIAAFDEEEIDVTLHQIEFETVPAQVRLDVLASIDPMVKPPA